MDTVSALKGGKTYDPSENLNFQYQRSMVSKAAPLDLTWVDRHSSHVFFNIFIVGMLNGENAKV